VVPEPNARVLTDPFFAETIVGLSESLDESDLQLVLLLARSGGRTEKIARFLAGGHVDGAVIASHHRDDALNRAVVELELPCVFIGRPLGVAHAHYVDMDNAGGARMATEHLVAVGRRRIGTIAGPADMTAGIDRLEGWRSAMTAAGLPDDAVAVGDFTRDGGREAVELLMAEHPDIDAIFAASDLMAVGAMGRLAALGVRVPEDVAVFGFDDLGFAETANPPLSTIAQPVARIAAQAGVMLRALMSGDEPDPEPRLFPATVVLRASA
jgi:DNA-binding LacI/PurR family transcriptional regulator